MQKELTLFTIPTLADESAKAYQQLLLPLLDAGEQEHYRTISHPARAIEYLWSHAASRLCVWKHFGRAIHLEFPPKSKPLVGAGQHISLSHTPQYIAFAVSPVEVGVDIERLDRFEATEKFLKKNYFTPVEESFINSLPDNLKQKRLVQIWTLMEALYKAENNEAESTRSFRKRQFIFEGENIRFEYVAEVGAGDEKNWQFHSQVFENDFILTTAYRSQILLPIQITRIDPIDLIDWALEEDLIR